MALNIIRRRIAKILQLKGPFRPGRSEEYNSKRRRGTFTRGATDLPIVVNTRLTQELSDRLESLCTKLRVQKGPIIRDALDFYLGMAEQEVLDIDPVTTGDLIPTTLAPDKIRRPDGAIVLLTEVDPGAKSVEAQTKKYKKTA